MSFTTLSDDEERELHRLSHVYWKEALKCEKAKAFLAGSVLVVRCEQTIPVKVPISTALRR